MIINGYWGEKTEEEKTTADSCGHIFTFQGREINRPEGKNNYLLLYIYHGRTKFFFKDKTAVSTDGDFVLYRPHEPQHHIYESNVSGEFYYVHFSTDNEELINLLEMQSSTLYHSVPSSEIADMFEELLCELQNKNKGYKTIALGLMQNLFVKINRQINKVDCFVPSTEISSMVQFINKNYMLNHSLDDYSKMCGLSKYHFIREFKKITSVSPLKYRAEIRLRHTQERLKNSNDSIKDIAEEAGYSSAEYFSDTFKKAMGISPLEYRKSNLHKK